MKVALKQRNEQSEIEAELSALVLAKPEEARAIKIADASGYLVAGKVWQDIRALRQRVADTFDALIENAHKAHKAVLAKKKEFDNPLETAERIIKGEMSRWDLEQDRIRCEKEEALIREARKKEEEERQRAAAEAWAVKDRQRAKEILAAPPAPIIAPVVVKETPKMVGGPVFQERWDFEVVDVASLPREFLLPNMTMIGAVVRSQKGKTNIPGVSVFSKRV